MIALRQQETSRIFVQGVQIERTLPVLTAESLSQFDLHTVNRQWDYVTGVAQRGLLPAESGRRLAGNHELRSILRQFLAVPVSEVLPLQFMQALEQSTDGAIRDLATGSQSAQLREYLQLPPVPDQYLTPDVMHAHSYQSDQSLLDDIMRSQRPLEMLKFMDITGVTDEERALVLRRYQMARDIKLLALGAELTQHPMPQAQRMSDGTMTYTLHSGIRIVAEANASLADIAKLLQPALWVNREPLKDRVWSANIHGMQPILLKERKTPRHRDTRGGEQNFAPTVSLPSAEEQSVARRFQSPVEPMHEQVLQFRWERPIASVTFPDGYSFCLFQRESGLIDAYKTDENDRTVRNFEAADALTQAIVHNAGRYRREYETVRRTMAARNIDSSAITFETFARIKAVIMLARAIELYRETITATGYTNSDLDGYAFRITDDGVLQLVGFDFEFYEPHVPGHELLYGTTDSAKAREFWMTRRLENLTYWRKGVESTEQERLLFRVMADRVARDED